MQEKDCRSGTFWKITLAALVCVFLIAMTVSMIIAGRRVSRVVDPNYYNNGLHYGDTRGRVMDGGASSGKR
jgi:hypothetical protein